MICITECEKNFIHRLGGGGAMAPMCPLPLDPPLLGIHNDLILAMDRGEVTVGHHSKKCEPPARNTPSEWLNEDVLYEQLTRLAVRE